MYIALHLLSIYLAISCENYVLGRGEPTAAKSSYTYTLQGASVTLLYSLV